MKSLGLPWRQLSWLILTALLVIFDQAVKYWVVNHLTLGQPIAYLPVLNFTLSYNAGVAFGFLHRVGLDYPEFLIAITFMISLGIFIWLWRLPSSEKITAMALSSILGGAMSNLIDRFIRGFVVDFIQVHWQDWYFPIFNLADAVITLGAVCLVILAFKDESRA